MYEVGDTVCSCEAQHVPPGTKFEYDSAGGDGHVFLKIVEAPDLEAIELQRIQDEVIAIVQEHSSTGSVIGPVARYIFENFERKDA